MGLTSTDDSVSIFKDGKLRPGVYKIQNIVGQTYVDIREHARELCCRPATVLEGKGLWEILPSGSGYTIRRLEPGKPDQFCIMLVGLGNENVVSVATFPVAWRMEIVHDERYRGSEYVRFFWGTTNMTWDLADFGSDNDRTRVQLKDNCDFEPCRIWRLIPVRLDAKSQIEFPPTVRREPRKSTLHLFSQTTEANDDGFGTTVVEVTVSTTTNTVTTRKKYRGE